MPILHTNFRARQHTYVRPRAIAYKPDRDWTQGFAMLIIFSVLIAAVAVNYLIDQMGWMP